MDGEEQPFTNKHFKAYFKNVLARFLWGAKYLHTRDIGISKNMYALFFCGGHLGGGAPIICGGARAPPPPVATPWGSVLLRRHGVH